MKDMEVGGSEVQCYPRLYSKFEASLGYKRLSKEIRKKKEGEGREERKRKEQMNKETCRWNEKAEMKVFQYKWKTDDEEEKLKYSE